MTVADFRCAGLLTAAVCLCACGPGELSRGQAKQLMQDRLADMGSRIVPVDPENFHESYRLYGIKWEPWRSEISGEHILALVEPKVGRLGAKEGVFGDTVFYLTLRDPTHFEIDVTGISAPSTDSGDRTVEFTVKQTGLPALVKQYAFGIWRGRYTFSRFDDGWRVSGLVGWSFGYASSSLELSESESRELERIAKAVDDQRVAAEDAKVAAAKAAVDARHRAIVATLTSGRTLTGLQSGNGRYSFQIRFVSFDPATGAVRAENRWIDRRTGTLKQPNLVEGILAGDQLTLNEDVMSGDGTERSRAFKLQYELALDPSGNKLVGQWKNPERPLDRPGRISIAL